MSPFQSGDVDFFGNRSRRALRSASPSFIPAADSAALTSAIRSLHRCFPPFHERHAAPSDSRDASEGEPLIPVEYSNQNDLASACCFISITPGRLARLRVLALTSPSCIEQAARVVVVVVVAAVAPAVDKERPKKAEGAKLSRALLAEFSSPRSTGFCAIWDCISPSSISGGLHRSQGNPLLLLALRDDQLRAQIASCLPHLFDLSSPDAHLRGDGKSKPAGNWR